MRKIFPGLLLLIINYSVHSQIINNEWINYNQTYYKFKVGSNGLYRINQPALASVGLSAVPAEQFQLWRNGTEVPIYTSATIGPLGITDFIEFYGQKNDGKLDKALFKYDSLQMSDKLSLYSDTAAYFLTFRAGVNKRYLNTVNSVAGNLLPIEAGFTYDLQKSYNSKQNSGYAVDYGELLYSSSYETAEGWTSGDVYPGSLLSSNNLYLNNAGGTSVLDAVIAGNSSVLRQIKVKINGTIVGDTLLNGFNIKRFHITNIPLSVFSGGTANIEFVNAGTGSDRIVVSDYDLRYPHNFNFEGKSQFSFELQAGGSKYLEITNFNFGTTSPVLLDLTNNLRMVGDVSSSMVRFVIPAAAATRSFVLLNSEPANINNVQNLQTRSFVDYSLVSNQGDYIIISHPNLFDDGSGINNVNKYRDYRNSAAGGNFNALVVDINQLIDQFAFGIKHHPAAIRNFGYYALAHFAVVPKYFYLIGKGLSYPDFKKYESDPNVNKLALVPTFGFPPSDNLLLAQRTQSTTQVSIGRLSAITGKEVGDYLDKVKQFELIQNSGPQTNANKGWMKNMAQITGAINDQSLASLINFFMDGYKQTASDTSFGGKVYSFNKNSGSYTAIGSDKTIDDLFAEGMSYLTYFGHSSPNTLEFNLDNPQNYNNTGKYPLIVVNGCNSGNLFFFDTLRSITQGTLSEKYIFAKNKGSIGFIADTHFGLPQQLNFFNEQFESNLANQMYGQPIGNIMKSTMQYMMATYTNDFASRIHAEEVTFHGDPALKLNPFAKPDYTIEDSMITFNPSVISVADENVLVTAKILNIGRGIKDSIYVLLQHQLPDNTVEVLAKRKIKATLFEDTVQFSLKLNPLNCKGINKIIVTIDPDNLVTELSETNNSITKNFTVIEDEIRPVFPYEYAIIGSNAGLALYGSTASPVGPKREYVMEMDTSRLFNSASKVVRKVVDSAGAIKFIPGVSLIDSTVYYWRMTPGPVTVSSRWLGSSFTFINGSPSNGFDQAHYFQFRDNSYESMNIDSVTRKFKFADKERKVTIRTGLYPYYLYDVINVNVDNDQVELYGCVYNSLQFLVYNPLTLSTWRNYNVSSTNGRFGSQKVCQNSASTDTTRAFFEFSYQNSASRISAMNFLDSIPDGYFVSVTNLGMIYNSTFINSWKADTAILGSKKSLWHKFHQLGLHAIDSFTNNIPFVLLFKKGDTVNFPVRQVMGPAANSHITDTTFITGKEVQGAINSPWFGPVKTWKNFKWNSKGTSPTNQLSFDIIGQMDNGNQFPLASVYENKDTSLSFIDAAIFPKLQLRMNHYDPQNASPTQLKYWMLTSDNYPEGAISPNLFYKSADTLTTADTLNLKVAFKNISGVPFDSLKVRLTISGVNDSIIVFNNLQNGARIRPILAGDSAIISYSIPLANFAGTNEWKLEVNPGNDQKEQFHFNNFLNARLYVINPVCPGTNITFTGASTTGTAQWQVNTGSGFSDISDNALYSGTNTAVLTINNAPGTMAGNKYRCSYTGDHSSSYSPEFILKFSSLWTGLVNDQWEEPGNWQCGSVPGAYSDVIIQAGAPNYPVVNGNTVCRSISAKDTTSILVKTGVVLTIIGK